jgi:hypothetical protein
MTVSKLASRCRCKIPDKCCALSGTTCGRFLPAIAAQMVPEKGEAVPGRVLSSIFGGEVLMHTVTL